MGRRPGSVGRVQSREGVRTVAGTPVGTPQTNGGALWVFDSTAGLMYGWSGTAWQQVGPLGAWTDFIPTLSEGWLLGDSTYTARYMTTGRKVTFYADITIGASATKGTNLGFALPVAAANVGTLTSLNVQYIDTGTATVAGAVVLASSSATVARLFAANAASTYLVFTAISATVPFTWATSDRIVVSGTYEAAA